MKKLKLCLYMLSFIMLFGGCGATIPDMSEEQRRDISEYAVGLLLKYNANQSDRLVDLSLLEEETEPEATAIPEAEPEATREPETTQDPQEVTEATKENTYEDLGKTLLLPEGVKLEFEDYQVVTFYGDDELMLEAGDGYCFLVVKCNMVNTGSDAKVVDMMQVNVKHTVVVDGTSVNAMVTMLSNDMTTYMGELAAEESKEVVLLAEVEEQKLHEAESIKVEFAREDVISGIIVK